MSLHSASPVALKHPLPYVYTNLDVTYQPMNRVTDLIRRSFAVDDAAYNTGAKNAFVTALPVVYIECQPHTSFEERDIAANPHHPFGQDKALYSKQLFHFPDQPVQNSVRVAVILPRQTTRAWAKDQWADDYPADVRDMQHLGALATAQALSGQAVVTRPYVHAFLSNTMLTDMTRDWQNAEAKTLRRLSKGLTGSIKQLYKEACNEKRLVTADRFKLSFG